MFRTAAAHIERIAKSGATLHKGKVAEDCFIFSALILHNVHIYFNSVSLMKSSKNYNAAFILGDSLPLLLKHVIVKGFSAHAIVRKAMTMTE